MPEEEEYVTPEELLGVKGDIILLREQLANMAKLLAESKAREAPQVERMVVDGGAPSGADFGRRNLAERVKFGKHAGARLCSNYENTPLWETRLKQAATTYGIAHCLQTHSALHNEDELLAMRTLIVDSIENEVLIHLECAFRSNGQQLSAIHPFLIFQRLKENWTSKMVDRTHLLQLELHNMELLVGEPIASFFDRIQTLWAKLVAVGDVVTTGRIIEVVVRACARYDKYSMVCLQIRGTKDCSVDMARSMLSQWDELLQVKEAQGPPTKRWGGVHAMGAHLQDDGPREVQDGPKVAQGVTMEQVMEMMQAMMSGSKKVGGGGGGMGGAPTPTCYNCGKKGHLRNECKGSRIGDGFTFSPKALLKKKEEH
jgi:hypothetical protein